MNHELFFVPIELARGDVARADGWWVEILRTGTWHGSSGGEVTITDADLDAMVAAFRETYPKVKPVLRLGDHPRKGDPKPAVGWVTDLVKKGDRALAYFTDVPEIVRKAIEAGRYKTVSAGLWRNWKDGDDGGKVHEWILNHVAILGAELPAVSGLADLAAYLTAGEDAAESVLAFTAGSTSNEETDEMKIEELQAELDRAKADLKAANDRGESLAKDLKEASEKIEALTGENAELRAGAAKAEVEKVVDDAISAGRMLPKSKDAAVKTGVALFSASHDAKDGESPFDAWKATLADGGKVIDTDEKSRTGKADESDRGSNFDAEFKAGAEAAEAVEKAARG